MKIQYENMLLLNTITKMQKKAYKLKKTGIMGKKPRKKSNNLSYRKMRNYEINLQNKVVII